MPHPRPCWIRWKTGFAPALGQPHPERTGIWQVLVPPNWQHDRSAEDKSEVVTVLANQVFEIVGEAVSL